MIDEEIYRKLLKTLTQNDLRKLLKTAHEILGRPLMLMNADYCWAMAEPQVPIGDVIFDDILKSGAVKHEFLFELEKLQCVQTVEKSTSIVFLDWGLKNQYPRVIAKMVQNDIIEGYLSVPIMDGNYDPSFNELVELVASTCLVLMNNQRNMETINGIRNKHNQLKSLFLRKLFGGKITSAAELEEWENCSDINLRKDYVVGLLCTPEYKDDSMMLKKIKRYMDKEFPQVDSVVLDSRMYLLFGGLREGQSPEDCLIKNRWLKKQFATMDIRLSFGNRFSNLWDIMPYKKQAITAIKIGMELDYDKNVFYYSDYVIYDIFSKVREKSDYRSYLHPAIEQLQRYDWSRGTEYVATLEAYVRSVCNKIKTMEKMHIHRNTLDYRLQKIIDITGIDFNDSMEYTHLLCSFYIFNTPQIDLSEK